MGECRSGAEPLPGASISQEEEHGGLDLDQSWVLWLCIPRLILGARVTPQCFWGSHQASSPLAQVLSPHQLQVP